MGLKKLESEAMPERLTCRSPKTALNSIFLRFHMEPCVPTEYPTELLGVPIENRY